MTAHRDLLFSDEIRETVRAAYRRIPTGAGRAVVERFYPPDGLAPLPQAALDWALGVGDPVSHAGLVAGETVLDVGCGGGIDSVLAARAVGATGRVIGLDLLPEMCERARVSAAQAGVGDRCGFHAGQMEAIELPDASVDVVLSNGVLNLSPRKSRALAEIARVLRPGGRLCVADLTVDGDLPPEVLGSPAAWAGCIAGAVSERVLDRKLRRAGLVDVELVHRVPFGIEHVAAYPLFDPEIVSLMRRLIPPAGLQRVAVGLIVRATRPPAVGVPASTTGPPVPAGRTAPTIGAPSGAIPLSELPPDAVEAPGVTVRHLKTVDDVELKVLDVAPGGSTPWHTHRHAHEGVVVTGTGHLRLAGRIEPLEPGHVFSVHPTEQHAVVNDGAEPLRFVCMDCFVE